MEEDKPSNLILSQNTLTLSTFLYPSFPTQASYFADMTTRPSRKAPSSLLSATKASVARTRSSSRLSKAKASHGVAADSVTPTESCAPTLKESYKATGGASGDPNKVAQDDALPVDAAANAPRDKPKPDSTSTDVALLKDSTTVEAVDGGEDGLASSSPKSSDTTAGIPTHSTDGGDPTEFNSVTSTISSSKNLSPGADKSFSGTVNDEGAVGGGTGLGDGLVTNPPKAPSGDLTTGTANVAGTVAGTAAPAFTTPATATATVVSSKKLYAEVAGNAAPAFTTPTIVAATVEPNLEGSIATDNSPPPQEFVQHLRFQDTLQVPCFDCPWQDSSCPRPAFHRSYWDSKCD